MNTKKIFAVLSLAAVVLSVSPGLASANSGNDKMKGFGRFWNGIFKRFEHKLPDTSFIMSGTVVSTTSNSVVVNVQASANVPNLVNSQATVMTDANTKIIKDKDTVITLANMVAGDRVEITGSVSGSVLTATKIHDSGKPAVAPAATVGKVT